MSTGANIVAGSTFEATSEDYSTPWTLSSNGTIRELGIRLNPHATKQVLRNDETGKAYRQQLAKSHQQSQFKKKELLARKSKAKLSNPNTQHQTCLPCGQSKEIREKRKIMEQQLRSSTTTHQATQ